jgi:hypothetical protein
MSYWFAFRVYQKGVDLEPRSPVLEGPFKTYQDAKKEKVSIRGGDMQKTSIFPAESKEEAENRLAGETWMV